MVKKILLLALAAGVFLPERSIAQLTKDDKKLEKIYKKYKDDMRLGELYIECGLVAEGKAVIEQRIAKGNCDGCQEKLDDLLFQSRYPAEVRRKYRVACYEITKDSSKDRGMNCLRALDFPLAGFTLSIQYEYNDHHPDSAMYYSERSADGGYPKSMFRLARYYHYGDGHEYRKCTPGFRDKMNLSKAMFWYQEAAAKGVPEAKAKLALLEKAKDTTVFQRGHAAYKAGEYKQAFDLWSIYAEGYQSATACFNLGCICSDWRTTHLGGIQEAETWFNRAGDLGMAEGYAGAGKCYWAEGYGSLAMESYQKAADMGYDKAAEKKQDIQNYLDAATAQRQRETREYLDNLKRKQNETSSYSNTERPAQNEKAKTWCSACAGSGKIHNTIYGGAKGPGGTTVFGEYSNCSACGGKGYK